MELHPLQVQIAMRGIALLKVGGIMAYSTCTFNPIENEAVVSELLRRCGESIKILKCKLEGFKCGDGISQWPVYDDQMREWTLEKFIKASSSRRKEGHILSEKNATNIKDYVSQQPKTLVTMSKSVSSLQQYWWVLRLPVEESQAANYFSKDCKIFINIY